MNNDDLKFFNEHFKQKSDIALKKKFSINHEAKQYEGVIELIQGTKDYLFGVKIPENYPYQNLTFCCKTEKGLPHQNHLGEVCLNTPFVNHLYTKIELDIEKLQAWIDKYSEAGQSDTNYEYNFSELGESVVFLFQEDGKYEIPNDEKFGLMTYSILNTTSDGRTISRFSALCQNIGNKEIDWSDDYKSYDKFKGIWLLLDSEPVLNKKDRITNWKDLIPILPEGFLKYFEQFLKRTGAKQLAPSGFAKKIFLCVGYYIPSKETEKEIHWDLILLPQYYFPKKNKHLNASQLKNYGESIHWERTENSSYSRFFGRGSFATAFSKAKILVIGVGAIGSSLCEVLVRGGIRYLDINDIDLIESGNICRSTYSFSDVGGGKTYQLKKKLVSISPFVDINITEQINPLSPYSSAYAEKQDELGNYDIIFDCSANNGILQMLTDMHLESKVFYLSITDKANEMICLTNQDCDNLAARRNQLLFSLGHTKEPSFMPGTGCWHPTFEASFFDINQLLNYTLKKINLKFKMNLPLKSFYSYFRNEQINNSEDICYVQEELGLKLRIEGHCLEKIYELVWAYFPEEFGGIFIGNYIDDYKEVVISDVLYPEDFENSPVRFTPNPNDLNSKLKKIKAKYGDSIVYIGDWHSHPNFNNHFSQPDMESIQAIAESPTVNTHNPIMMIVAFGENYFDPGFYVYSKGQLYKYQKL